MALEGEGYKGGHHQKGHPQPRVLSDAKRYPLIGARP